MKLFIHYLPGPTHDPNVYVYFRELNEKTIPMDKRNEGTSLIEYDTEPLKAVWKVLSLKAHPQTYEVDDIAIKNPKTFFALNYGVFRTQPSQSHIHSQVLLPQAVMLFFIL